MSWRSQIFDLDLIFRRSLILSKLFTKSWGQPKHLETILRFHRRYIGRGLVNELIDKHVPKMVITKQWTKRDVTYVDGQFVTPMYNYCAELYPKNVETCYWRGIFPGPNQARKGLVIHLAGTGDHTYVRRELGFAKDLVKKGYSSILVENPFYGNRKPADQFSSSLMNVTDLFVMGASLIGECNFLLRWAKSQGHYPLGISGVSMGGFMACLAASNVPEPIALVPCLSWTTAAPVYTEGALSEAINWQALSTELASPDFRRAIEAIPDCDWLQAINDQSLYNRHDSEAKRFMWLLMEQFTSLKSYPLPVDTSLVKAVIAEADAYVIRNDVPDLAEVWPGSKVVVMPNVGHVLGYSQGHALFRQTVNEMMCAANALSTNSTDPKPTVPPPPASSSSSSDTTSKAEAMVA